MYPGLKKAQVLEKINNYTVPIITHGKIAQ